WGASILKQKARYDMGTGLEFRRGLLRSQQSETRHVRGSDARSERRGTRPGNRVLCLRVARTPGFACKNPDPLKRQPRSEDVSPSAARTPIKSRARISFSSKLSSGLF